MAENHWQRPRVEPKERVNPANSTRKEHWEFSTNLPWSIPLKLSSGKGDKIYTAILFGYFSRQSCLDQEDLIPTFILSRHPSQPFLAWPLLPLPTKLPGYSLGHSGSCSMACSLPSEWFPPQPWYLPSRDDCFLEASLPLHRGWVRSKVPVLGTPLAHQANLCHCVPYS